MSKAMNEFLFEGDVNEKTIIKYPITAHAIVCTYILFVKWIGPAIMRNRKPFKLKNAMIVYDFMQCFANAYITYTLVQFIRDTWHGRCMMKQQKDLPLYMKRLYRVAWHLYLTKYADLIDTCFFVLRKKNTHVSFLHVFHHSLMCIFSSWLIRSLNSIGYYLGVGLAINTGVHVIMYLYYGLSAMGPTMAKYLWWKKYFTLIQIAQFTVVLIYMAEGFLTGCEEFAFQEITMFIFVFLLLILFINFYKNDNKNKKD